MPSNEHMGDYVLQSESTKHYLEEAVRTLPSLEVLTPRSVPCSLSLSLFVTVTLTLNLYLSLSITPSLYLSC